MRLVLLAFFSALQDGAFFVDDPSSPRLPPQPREGHIADSIFTLVIRDEEEKFRERWREEMREVSTAGKTWRFVKGFTAENVYDCGEGGGSSTCVVREDFNVTRYARGIDKSRKRPQSGSRDLKAAPVYAGHILMLEEVVRIGEVRPVLILESDISLSAAWMDKLSAVLENLEAVDPLWDILVLQPWGMKKATDLVGHDLYNVSITNYDANYLGLAAYLVKPSSVIKLLSTMRSGLIIEIDKAFLHFAQANLIREYAHFADSDNAVVSQIEPPD